MGALTLVPLAEASVREQAFLLAVMAQDGVPAHYEHMRQRVRYDPRRDMLVLPGGGQVRVRWEAAMSLAIAASYGVAISAGS
jgi:hypothetical protein